MNEQIEISSIRDPFLIEKNIQLDILRLDLIHPQISGNKWFKLKYNIEEALQLKAESILSFGGAYSNHLHALAYSGKLFGIKTIGLIRGEEVDNHTLNDCKLWGMSLHFIARNEYRQKSEFEFIQSIQQKFPTSYMVPEGGNNELGRKGCNEILQNVDTSKYSYICCAVGTGATLSGIAQCLELQQLVLGFSAIKNGHYLESEIKANTNTENWRLVHDYHFGGFAKTNASLLSFLTIFETNHQVALDIVYTGKMMFGLYDMISKNTIPKGSNILFIHSGGLQGNRSLSPL